MTTDTTAPAPTHHLLIASEQLWPNLLGLAVLQQRDGGVASLHILHTGDRQRSEQPAKRIASVAKKIFPALVPALVPTGSTSQEVLATAHAVIARGGRPGRWTINCSGGTKTMFGGLVPLVRQPEIEAFYREVSGDWYKLAAVDVKGLQAITCEEWLEPKQARLKLPVAELATLQIEHPSGATWSQKPPPILDVEALVRSGIAGGWDWRSLQRQFSVLEQKLTGLAFEGFFSALVKLCGAGNVALQLKLEEAGVPRQEFDVIASTGRKIVLFDLKMTDDASDAVINQLSRLAEDRRSLGGLAGEAIAVRPTWQKDETVMHMARAHQIRLWSQEDMPDLISSLVQVLELSPPGLESPAYRVENLLKHAAAEGKRLFSSARIPRTPITQSSIEDRVGWVTLARYFAECSRSGCRLVVLDTGDRFLIRGSRDHMGSTGTNTLNYILSHLAKVEFYRAASTSGNFTALLLPLPGKIHELRELLTSLLPSP